MRMAWVTIAHLCGLFVWIGALLAIARVAHLHGQAPVQPAVGARLTAISRGLYWRFALPGAFVAIACGVVLLNAQRDLLKQPFMHAKLFAVLCLIGCDHLCLRALKRQATGGGSPEKRGGWLQWAVLACAAGAVICIILRPWERA
jgi:putative membrane protein